MATRVVVADDQTLIREALSTRLREQADMEVVGQAADGDAVMELTAHLQPDVIVMDDGGQGMATPCQPSVRRPPSSVLCPLASPRPARRSRTCCPGPGRS